MDDFARGHEGRIRELDGWRGVSILLVVLHHALFFAFPAIAAISPKLQHVLGYAGDFGVRIFFVISGWVITRILILEERKFGSISLRGFYTRRLFRIVPVYYCFLLAVSVLSWLSWIPTSRNSVLVSALFLFNFRRVFHLDDWFVGHSWTLAVEEQFYLSFPLFWMLAPRRKRAALLFGALAIFLAWSFLSAWGWMGTVVSSNTIVGFSCINVGVLLAVFERQVLEFTAKLPSWPIFFLSVLFLIHPVGHSNLAEGIYSICVPFGVALMLTHTVARRGWHTRALNFSAIQWCGLVSYSAYLWQELFTGSTSSYGSPAAGRAFHLLLPLLPLIAALSFYWVERPCTRLGRRLALRLRAREEVNAALGAAAS